MAYKKSEGYFPEKKMLGRGGRLSAFSVTYVPRKYDVHPATFILPYALSITYYTLSILPYALSVTYYTLSILPYALSVTYYTLSILHFVWV
jgi:hypothetical protein